MKYNPTPKTGLVVGYARLPSRTREGSKADYAKTFTKSVRGSMVGILANFEAVLASLKVAAPDALEEALAPTFERALLYTPVDTGQLQASAQLTSGFDDGGKAHARISFGGAGSNHYAAIVHERTDLRHQAPTRSKYLQAAVEETLGGMKRRFAIALKRSTGFG